MANEERRSFLRWAIHGMGALFAAVLGIPALTYLADARHRKAPNREFRPVQGIKLNELVDGVPKQGTILDVRTDAWTLHPNDVVGRVWVIKKGNNLKVFTTICPHLGCSINADPGTPCPGFTCPCHGGKFHLDGALDNAVANNPAPRGMDSLDFQRVRDPENQDANNKNLLLVKYQNFKQGEHEKKDKA
jgi:Rieske Fe-S protein